MAHPRDPRIDAYIAHAAPFARPILRHLRQLIHRGNPGVEETIKWSCPFFLHRGQLFCSFAAFKAHAAFGFHHQGMEALLTKELGRTTEAMGLLGRITARADLPGDATLLSYIRTAKKLYDRGLPRRPRTKPRPALPVPADLAAALQRNRKAAAAWTGFAPSHRREYSEWITEAKRGETRAKRLATTLHWLAAGRKRNWRYENC